MILRIVSNGTKSVCFYSDVDGEDTLGGGE